MAALCPGVQGAVANFPDCRQYVKRCACQSPPRRPPSFLHPPQRLQMSGADAASSQPLPQQLLRKFLAYARAHVHPVLSDDAKDALQV